MNASRAATTTVTVTATEPQRDGVLRDLGISGCVRLPLRIDAARIAAELDRLPESAWGLAGRDPVVLASVDSFFAIGYPRGPRPQPADDRAVLDELPALRAALRDLVPATPTRAIVARMRPRSVIPIHTDTRRFFAHTVRLSFQVSSAGAQPLFCDGRHYRLAPGEVWAVDNLLPHGVHNASDAARVNVVADYAPSPALVALLASGDRGLGAEDAGATATLAAMSRARYRSHRWRGIGWELFKRVWRRAT